MPESRPKTAAKRNEKWEKVGKKKEEEKRSPRKDALRITNKGGITQKSQKRAAKGEPLLSLENAADPNR